MHSTVKIALAAMFQDVAKTIQDRLGLDPLDRLMVLEVAAMRLRFGGLRGPNVRELADSVGIPYETARRKVIDLEDRGHLVRKSDGLDLANAQAIWETYDEVGAVVYDRLAPLMDQLAAGKKPIRAAE